MWYSVAGEACKASRGYTSAHVLLLKGGLCIDAKKHWMGAMNCLSRNNNAEVRNTGGVFARSFINTGDEICMAYGASYWRVHGIGIENRG